MGCTGPNSYFPRVAGNICDEETLAGGPDAGGDAIKQRVAAACAAKKARETEAPAKERASEGEPTCCCATAWRI